MDRGGGEHGVHTCMHASVRAYMHAPEELIDRGGGGHGVHTCMHASVHASVRTCMHACMHTNVRAGEHGAAQALHALQAAEQMIDGWARKLGAL